MEKQIRTKLGRAVRTLLREGRSGAFATTIAEGGAPLNALVTYATNYEMAPLFLFSTLSDHTKNLLSNPSASFLVEAASRLSNPQRGPRVALVGKVEPTNDEAHRLRFLARHPYAKLYAGFSDFSMYRMRIERAHFVGGFAQAHWLNASDVLLAEKPGRDLAAIENEIIEHMNMDHSDALNLFANNLLGRRGNGWTLSGIDVEGLDLRHNHHTARLWFDEPILSADSVRKKLVMLTKKARE